MDEKAEIIDAVCQAVLRGRLDFARRVVNTRYPWNPREPLDHLDAPRLPTPPRFPGEESHPRRTLGREDELRIWRQDGFRDRYSGERLVFPGALILLAVVLRDVFPYGNPPNADRSVTHQAMYELYPVLDHIIPLSRPRELRAARITDPHADCNLATTSTANNTAKARFLHTELGWTLHPSGARDEWDGLTDCFGEYLSRDAAPFTDGTHGGALRAWAEELDLPVPT